MRHGTSRLSSSRSPSGHCLRPASPPLDQDTYYWLGESGSCTPDRASEGVLYYAVTSEDVVVPATEFPLVAVDYLVP